MSQSDESLFAFEIGGFTRFVRGQGEDEFFAVNDEIGKGFKLFLTGGGVILIKGVASSGGKFQVVELPSCQKEQIGTFIFGGTLFGVGDISFFSAEGLDIFGNDPEKTVSETIQKIHHSFEEISTPLKNS